MNKIEEFKIFLREDTPWPGITEYRKTIGLETDWADFVPLEPLKIPRPTRYPEQKPGKLSQQTQLNLIKVHIHQ